MIGELAAVAAILLVPASMILGVLAVIGLGLAGLASSDLDEGRLIRG